MRICKKMMACLLAVAMLASMAVVVSAAETAAIGGVVGHSITEEVETGFGLAFLIKMNVKGAQVNKSNEFVNTTATAVVDGVEYAVVKMGAVVTNKTEYVDNVDALTLEDVNDQRTVMDVTAKYLFTDPAADYCEYAVRVINLPQKAMGRAVVCRPYVVLQDAQGNETVVYGSGDFSTYNVVYYQNNPEKAPVLNLNVANVDDKITVSATAEHLPYATAIHAEAFQVSMTLKNVTTNKKTSAGDFVTYACKDTAGNVLSTEKVAVDVLDPGASKSVTFYAPIGTATIEAVEKKLTYVSIPVITLPAIGSDIDVTKKKDRIRVSATSAAYNPDGTIQVSLTFTNYSTRWITEETDYVQYTCYNAAGTAIKTATLYIGVIDTKKNPVKTFTFNVPANTASVKITKSQITYWTEWA